MRGPSPGCRFQPRRNRGFRKTTLLVRCGWSTFAVGHIGIWRDQHCPGLGAPAVGGRFVTSFWAKPLSTGCFHDCHTSGSVVPATYKERVTALRLAEPL